MKSDWAPLSLRSVTLSFYTACEGSNNQTVNPFEVPLRHALTTMDVFDKQLNTVTQLVTKFYPPKINAAMLSLLKKLTKDVEASTEIIENLLSLLECRRVLAPYNQALHASCNTTL